MLHEVDKVLEKLLRSAADKLRADITFGSGASSKDKNQIQITLFDVRENLHLRDESPKRMPGPEEGTTLKKLPGVKLDLSYLITTQAKSSAEEHQLLGEVLRELYRNPIVPKDFLTEEMILDGNERIFLSVSQMDHRSHERPETIFRSLGIPMKPAIWLTVTSSFDPWDTETIRVVRHALVGLGLIQPNGNAIITDVTQSQVSVTGVIYEKIGTRKVPLANAEVTIDGLRASVNSNELGVFFFTDIAPGKYSITISKAGYEPVIIESIAPPQGRVDLVKPVEVLLTNKRASTSVENGEFSHLNGFGSMTITVRGDLRYPDGEPAAAVVVKCGGRTTVTDRNGSYIFEGLPPQDPIVVAEITGRGEVPVKMDSGSPILERVPSK